MTIFLNILFLVVGMILLIKGADFFVSGASAVAKRMKVPPIFIGLTIVAIGTSLPELSVSISSAIAGSIDLSAGNIVGSNMLNMCLILGIVAVIHPVKLEKTTKKIDLPFLVSMTGILMLFCFDVFLNGEVTNVLTRTESIIFIILLVLYLYILIFNANRTRKRKIRQDMYLKSLEPQQDEQPEQKNEQEKTLKIWQIVVYIIFGLGAVIFGGECVSSTAQYLALAMGMSEALVGLTIVALGTSLPELVTSVVASKKKENDLALGNIIGSNIMNISLVLGSVGLIAQAPVSMVIVTDFIILFVFTLIFAFMCFKSEKIKKSHGIILLSMYFAYLAFAIIRNYCF